MVRFVMRVGSFLRARTRVLRRSFGRKQERCPRPILTCGEGLLVYGCGGRFACRSLDLLRMENKLLHAVSHELCRIDQVLRRASETMDRAHFARLPADVTEPAEYFAVGGVHFVNTSRIDIAEEDDVHVVRRDAESVRRSGAQLATLVVVRSRRRLMAHERRVMAGAA